MMQPPQYGPPPGYGPPGYGQPEPVFYQDAHTFVSRSRIVLNGVTYPVAAISAVASQVIPKSTALAILGVLAIMFGVLFCFASVAGGIFCFLCGGAGIAIYIWGQSDRYVLLLATAGMQRQALVSPNREYVGAILNAINNALASR